MTRVLGFAVGLSLLSFAGLCLVQGRIQGQDQPDSKKTTPVIVKECRIKLIDSAVLSSPRPGVLAFVEPREGDDVAANAHVAGLMDEVADAAYQSAKIQAENDIEVRFAQKSYELALTEYEKSVLANKKAVHLSKKMEGAFPVFPEIEVARLKLAADKAELQIEQASRQREVDSSKAEEALQVLKTYKIEAPFDGFVTKVYKTKGEGVREGEAVLEVVSTKRVRVEGHLHIRDIWSIKQRAYVQVKLDIPEVDLEVEKIVFEGRVKFVDVKVQPVTGDIRVWAEVENKDNILRDGLTATMTIFPGKQPPPAVSQKTTPRTDTAAGP